MVRRPGEESVKFKPPEIFFFFFFTAAPQRFPVPGEGTPKKTKKNLEMNYHVGRSRLTGSGIASSRPFRLVGL